MPSPAMQGLWAGQQSPNVHLAIPSTWGCPRALRRCEYYSQAGESCLHFPGEPSVITQILKEGGRGQGWGHGIAGFEDGAGPRPGGGFSP